MPRTRRDRLLLLLALVAGIAAVVFVHWIHTRGYIDTGIYRLGAQAWLDGREVYGGDLTPVSSPDTGTLPFIYPPFALLLFVPLTWMSLGAAIVAVAVCSHLAVLVTAYSFARCSPYLAPHAGWTAVATGLLTPFLTLLEPARETLNYGQINLVLMGLVAADCLLPQPVSKHVRWPRGLLVGIAGAIKLTPLAFVLLFLLRRDTRAAAISFLTFASTVLLGLLVAPDGSAAWWTEKMISIGDSFGTVYAGNLNLRSLIAKQEVTGPALDVLWLGGCLVLLGLAVLGMRQALRVGNTPLALVLNAVLALLVSPISWSHHWVWAGPALALVFAMSLRHGWYGITVTVAFCTAAFLVGPQWYLPYGSERELDWTFSQQVVGNAYTLIGTGFLVAAAVAWFRLRPRNRPPAAPVAGHGFPSGVSGDPVAYSPGDR